MNGKEFKEELLNITKDYDKKTFFMVDDSVAEHVQQCLIDLDENFKAFKDPAYLMAEVQSNYILNNTSNYISDDADLKIDPVSFVQEVTDSIFNDTLLEDGFNDNILKTAINKIKTISNNKGEI